MSTPESSRSSILVPDGKTTPIDTDYQIGQQNYTGMLGPLNFDIHNRVFLVSGFLILTFVISILVLQSYFDLEDSFISLRSQVVSNLDWFFLSAGNLFVIACLVLAFSPLGRVRIGGTEAKPSFSYLAWFSMLFAAGMGIGLLFYGVSEPLTHYNNAMAGTIAENGARTDWSPLSGAAGNAEASTQLSLSSTIFHFGLHPWAIYAVLALGLAIFSFNKGLPLTVRSIFYPILGERVWGWPGHIIDTLAILATLFGLATSLGLGASQAVSGLNFLFDIPINTTSKVILIAIISAIALVSVVAGLDAGVKRLSEANMILAIILLVFVIIVGPTLFLFQTFGDSIVAYATNLPALSNPFGREDSNFSQFWTSFYWAWWISWSPFVGMFIARVSRGRTVREFMISVLLVPSIACALWMSVFGGTAIHQVITDNYQAAANAELPLQLFKMLDALPWAQITSFVAVVLVIVFFVTSSDSGSLVIDVISAGGKIDAPVAQRVFWCVLQGAVAIALLLGGGLTALQALTVSAGFPFTIILLVATVSLFIGLANEPKAK